MSTTPKAQSCGGRAAVAVPRRLVSRSRSQRRTAPPPHACTPQPAGTASRNGRLRRRRGQPEQPPPRRAAPRRAGPHPPNPAPFAVNEFSVYDYSIPTFGKGVVYDVDQKVRTEQFRFFTEALKKDRLKKYVPLFVMEAEVRGKGQGGRECTLKKGGWADGFGGCSVARTALCRTTGRRSERRTVMASAQARALRRACMLLAAAVRQQLCFLKRRAMRTSAEPSPACCRLAQQT
eukprot:351882-Chlamydomonas_euryale.AAC.11